MTASISSQDLAKRVRIVCVISAAILLNMLFGLLAGFSVPTVGTLPNLVATFALRR